MVIVSELRNPGQRPSSDLWFKGFFFFFFPHTAKSSLDLIIPSWLSSARDAMMVFICFSFGLPCSRLELILTNAEGLELYLQIQLNVQVYKKQKQFNSSQ